MSPRSFKEQRVKSHGSLTVSLTKIKKFKDLSVIASSDEETKRRLRFREENKEQKQVEADDDEETVIYSPESETDGQTSRDDPDDSRASLGKLKIKSGLFSTMHGIVNCLKPASGKGTDKRSTSDVNSPMMSPETIEQHTDGLTVEEAERLLAKFALDVKMGQIQRPAIFQPVRGEDSRSIDVASERNSEICFNMNRAIDALIDEYHKMSEREKVEEGLLSTIQSYPAGRGGSSVEKKSKVKKTVGKAKAIFTLGMDFGEKINRESRDKHPCKPQVSSLTDLPGKVQKMIFELIMPNGAHLTPFSHMSPASSWTSKEDIARLADASSIILALCKRRHPKTLVSGDIARNILYRNNIFTFTHAKAIMRFIETIGPINLSRLCFLSNFKIAQSIFSHETHTPEFHWFRRWLPDLRTHMRGQSPVYSIGQWHVRKSAPMPALIVEARAMLDLRALDGTMDQMMAASRAGFGYFRSRAAIAGAAAAAEAAPAPAESFDFKDAMREVQMHVEKLCQLEGLVDEVGD